MEAMGILAVEMEAAGLYGVAAERGGRSPHHRDGVRPCAHRRLDHVPGAAADLRRHGGHRPAKRSGRTSAQIRPDMSVDRAAARQG